MNILLTILCSTLIIVDLIALRKVEKKNKKLTQENIKLKKIIEKGV